jgi:hypothetical protein
MRVELTPGTDQPRSQAAISRFDRPRDPDRTEAQGLAAFDDEHDGFLDAEAVGQALERTT